MPRSCASFWPGRKLGVPGFRGVAVRSPGLWVGLSWLRAWRLRLWHRTDDGFAVYLAEWAQHESRGFAPGGFKILRVVSQRSG